MADMDKIESDVREFHGWKPVIEHRVTTLEELRQQDVRNVIRLEAEIGQVDRKVSRIEGGIDFLKWSIPISITFATAIGGAIVWILSN